MQAQGFEISAVQFGDDSSPFLSAPRLSEQLGVTQSELAKLAGIAPQYAYR